MKVGKNVHFIQICYSFCGEKDGVGIYGGGTNKKRRILNFNLEC